MRCALKPVSGSFCFIWKGVSRPWPFLQYISEVAKGTRLCQGKRKPTVIRKEETQGKPEKRTA